MITISLDEIARLVDGRLTGDGTLSISGAATIRDARESEITLADKPQLATQLAKSKAAAVVVSSEFVPEGIPYITVEDVREAFTQIVAHFHPVRPVERIGVSPQAHISPTATLGEDVDVHPGATIGERVTIGTGSTIHAGVHVLADSQIGENVIVFPGVTLYENTILGDRVLIHSNTVIGAYGFGYETVDGTHCRNAQLGNVIVEDDVEVGANATIDRGTYGPTVIGQGTKIDNQVMVAHNCRIGRHNILCAQVGIAGSTTTGDYVVMAGQVGVRDHVHIGDQAILLAKAGVKSDVPAGETWVGLPAAPEREWWQQYVLLTRLPEMRKGLRRMKREIQELRDMQESCQASVSAAEKDVV